MLTITKMQLQDSAEPLMQLAQTKGLPDKTALRIAKALRECQLSLNSMQMEANKIRLDIFEESTPTNDIEARACEERIKLAVMELADEPIYLNFKPIKLSGLSGFLPPPGHLMVLDWFFEDDISESEALQAFTEGGGNDASDVTGD